MRGQKLGWCQNRTLAGSREMADISTDDAIHPDLCRADVLNCIFEVAEIRSDRPIDDVTITGHRGERITNQRNRPSCGFPVSETPHNVERIRKRQHRHKPGDRSPF